MPISLTQLARVQVSDPRLQAILNGQEVSLGGVMVGAEQATTRQRLGRDEQRLEAAGDAGNRHSPDLVIYGIPGCAW